MQTQEIDDMGVTGSGTEKKVPINFRIPESTRAGLDDVMRLWRLVAAQQGNEVDAVDLSYVVRRLLRIGIRDAFAEYGGVAESEADWRRIEAAIQKKIKR